MHFWNRFVRCFGNHTRSDCLELVENTIQISSIKNQADALRNADQPRAPDFIECSPLDAHVSQGLGVGQSAFHVFLLAVTRCAASVNLTSCRIRFSCVIEELFFEHEITLGGQTTKTCRVNGQNRGITQKWVTFLSRRSGQAKLGHRSLGRARAGKAATKAS